MQWPKNPDWYIIIGAMIVFLSWGGRVANHYHDYAKGTYYVALAGVLGIIHLIGKVYSKEDEENGKS